MAWQVPIVHLPHPPTWRQTIEQSGEDSKPTAPKQYVTASCLLLPALPRLRRDSHAACMSWKGSASSTSFQGAVCLQMAAKSQKGDRLCCIL